VLPGKLDIAIRAYHQQSSRRYFARYKLQEQQGRSISPVQVVQDKHHRLSVRGIAKKTRDSIKKSEAGLLWILNTWQWPEVRQQFSHIWHNLSDSRRTLPYLGT